MARTNDYRDNNPHLAVLLPEIVQRIPTFLPTSVLLTCTQINSTWEAAARKRLLFQSWLTVDPENITDYTNVVTARGSCPRNIGFFRVKNPAICSQPAWLSFTSEHGHKIKLLQINLTLRNPTWPQYLSNLATSFPNLTSLKLFISLPNNSDLTNSPPQSNPPLDNFTFPKLKHLEFTSYSVPEGCPHLHAMITRMIPLFPNLRALSCIERGQSVLEHFLTFAPTLTSILLKNAKLRNPLRLNLTNLTRLEFSQCWSRPSDLPKLLRIGSGTLVHVKIYVSENVDPSHRFDRFGRHPVIFPIMERLTIFELAQSPRVDSSLLENSPVAPGIQLKFKQGENNDPEKRLDYAVQFPVLEKIKISKMENNSSNYGQRGLTEQEYFATGKAFLYDSFLYNGNSQGLTVTKLDIPFPPGSCGCLETEEASIFWDRVIAMFPNVERCHAMGTR
ncbi:uncharacterized protein LOC118439468 [Folsomia candida]|uniref:F-box domain-containing protein n=1 Tax=Folsomia candida TaxID=158441 RepID=A0A226D358_FOLCA|nr:uncharacterized protein LOC118439468 [Folsomia candida]XP_035716684.1 uncharacterized protein LOC118439468 [Folsomia candida]OXA40012.1 hypothetical protein Fcan01_25364 [Folsomia candida]